MMEEEEEEEEPLRDIEDALPSTQRLAAAPESGLAAALVEWFDENRRLLPWRGDGPETLLGEPGQARRVQSVAEASEAVRDAKRRPVAPYETWVSEVMLQQTRVDTVVDFFQRWIAAFPTVEALAAASEDEVNARWAGLGYYRRARNLHRGAQLVASEMGGKLPADVKALLKIPGIGAYTAGAIASIAFGLSVPLVDGNVVRVFSRLCAVARDAKDTALAKGCWALAEALVPDERPGDFNQALMELGATVCTPKNPRCEVCPAQRWCAAYAQDPSKVTDFPRKSKAKTVPLEAYAVGVLEREAEADKPPRYLLVRRPRKGLLAGQWEFVGVQVAEASAEEHRAALDARLREDSLLAEVLPCAACLARAAWAERGAFTHKFSHIHHRLHVHRLQAEACDACKTEGRSECGGAAWMTREEMAAVGLPKPTQTCLDMATKTAAPAKRKAVGKPGAKRTRVKAEQEDKSQAKLTGFLVAPKNI